MSGGGARPTLHVITGLNRGGAESMLLRLVGQMDRSHYPSAVVSLIAAGSLQPQIEQLGVPCFDLGMRAGGLSPSAILKLRTIVRDLKPRLCFGWMYHGNLAALLASVVWTSGAPVIWNIRHTPDSLMEQKPLTRASIRLGAMLSSRARRIVYNSRVSLVRHEKLGYAAERGVVIPNGFDTEVFRSQPDAYEWLRTELGVPAGTTFVGIIAHFSPMKDHDNFIAAASRLRLANPAVEFVMCGMGVTKDNASIRDSLNRHGLLQGVHLLGERTDIARITAAMDVVVSSSAWGEGFQNAIGEALACEVPCVVTDVGDASHVVGDSGRVVPSRDSAALAMGIASVLGLGTAERYAMGRAGRARVERLFALPAVARQYEALQDEVLGVS